MPPLFAALLNIASTIGRIYEKNYILHVENDSSNDLILTKIKLNFDWIITFHNRHFRIIVIPAEIWISC